MTEHASSSKDVGPDARGFAKVTRWMRGWWRRPEKQRLRAEIFQAETQYSDLKERLQSDSEDRLRRLESVRDKLIGFAKTSLGAGDIDNGWRFMQELEREMVPVLDSMELNARFLSVKSEAKEKLSSWRSKAVEQLIEHYERNTGDSDSEHSEALNENSKGSTSSDHSSSDFDAVSPSTHVGEKQRIVQEILFHLHCNHQNTYYKIGKLRGQLRIAGTIMLATLALILALNALDFFKSIGESVKWKLWVAAVSGFTGGALSVVSSVVRADSRRRIPEVATSFAVTLMRPLVGAAIALPLLFLVEAGLIRLGTNSDVGLLTLCFIGGFSERWFLGIVEGLGERVQ